MYVKLVLLAFAMVFGTVGALKCREGYTSESWAVTDDYKIVDCPSDMEDPMCLTIQAESYNSWGQHVTVDYYTCSAAKECGEVSCNELQKFINQHRDDVTVKDCKRAKCCDNAKCNDKTYKEVKHKKEEL